MPQPTSRPRCFDGRSRSPVHLLLSAKNPPPLTLRLPTIMARQGEGFTSLLTAPLNSAFIPDFVIRNDATGARVFLEVLGFWTPEHLRERLLEFDHAGVRNFILAAWDELRGTRDPMTNVPPNTIVFKRNLDPALVALAADGLTASP